MKKPSEKKMQRAIAKVQKLLAKSIALRNKMDALRLAADEAVKNLSEEERTIINRTEGLDHMPELIYNCAMDTVIKESSWGDFHA